VVKIKSNGKLELVSKEVGATDDFEIVSGSVYEKDGDYIKLFVDTNSNGKWDAGETVGDTFYRVNSDTVIYEEDDKKRLSNITKGTAVDIIVEDGKEARVIEIK
ncbi:hypothetical protein, partial [Tepidibacter thalassicus]